MDNIKTLVEKGQYDLVIKLTKDPLSNEDIFYRITAFIGLNRGVDALNCLEKYRKVLEKDLPILMKIHIQLLCALGLFEKAYNEVKYYEGLPYHSQQAEEMLKTLNSYIKNEEKRLYQNHELTVEEIKNRLNSKDPQEVLFGLDQLRDKEIGLFYGEVCQILHSFPKQSVRSFALLELVMKKVNKTVKFLNYQGKLIDVNPSKLDPLFSDKDLEFAINKINLLFNDVSLSKTGEQLLSSYMICLYPEKVVLDDTLLQALYEVSCLYMKKEVKPLNERCKEKSLDYQKVQKIVQDIDKAMEDF